MCVRERERERERENQVCETETQETEGMQGGERRDWNNGLRVGYIRRIRRWKKEGGRKGWEKMKK